MNELVYDTDCVDVYMDVQYYCIPNITGIIILPIIFHKQVEDNDIMWRTEQYRLLQYNNYYTVPSRKRAHYVYGMSAHPQLWGMHEYPYWRYYAFLRSALR